MKRNEYITFTNPVAVRVADIKNWYGAVPETFNKCFKCEQPAVWLVCVCSDEFAPDVDYGQTDAQALAQELRARLRTNLEFPVCKSHLDGRLF